jgi:hypothetical protein
MEPVPGNGLTFSNHIRDDCHDGNGHLAEIDVGILDFRSDRHDTFFDFHYSHINLAWLKKEGGSFS